MFRPRMCAFALLLLLVVPSAATARTGEPSPWDDLGALRTIAPRANGIVLGDGRGYVAWMTSARRLQALDARTGRRWTWRTPDACPAAPRTLSGTRVLLHCGAGTMRMVDVRTGRTIASRGIARIRELDDCEVEPSCGLQVYGLGRRWVAVAGSSDFSRTLVHLESGRVETRPRGRDQVYDLDAEDPLRTLCATFAGTVAPGMQYGGDWAVSMHSGWYQRCGGKRISRPHCGPGRVLVRDLLVLERCTRGDEYVVVRMLGSGRSRAWRVRAAQADVSVAVAAGRLYVQDGRAGPVRVGRLPR